MEAWSTFMELDGTSDVQHSCITPRLDCLEGSLYYFKRLLPCPAGTESHFLMILKIKGILEQVWLERQPLTSKIREGREPRVTQRLLTI